MAGSTNAIALVPMDPSGYDSSEPAAMDLVHARRQTGLGLPRVGAARRHLPYALAAPDCAGGGTDRGACGGGVGCSNGTGDGRGCPRRGCLWGATGAVVLA